MIKGIFGLTPNEIKRERRKDLVSGYSDIMEQAQARGDNTLMTGGGMLLGTLLGKMATEKFGGIDTEMQEAEQRQANLQQLQKRIKEGMTPQEYEDIGLSLMFSEDEDSRAMGAQLLRFGITSKTASKIEPSKPKDPDNQDVKGAQDFLTKRLSPYLSGQQGQELDVEEKDPASLSKSGVDTALASEYNSIKAEYNDLLEAGQISRSEYPTSEIMYQQATDKLISTGMIRIGQGGGLFGVLSSPKILFGMESSSQPTTQVSKEDQELLDKYN